MKNTILIYLTFLINIHIFASEQNNNNISVKQMLLSGPSEIKLHSLAMITQGKINDKLDDSYIEALEVCSNDKYVPVRMTTAKILGKYYVKDKKIINPKVISILKNLAKDKNEFVSNAAIKEGLIYILNNDDEEINTLINSLSIN